MIKLENIKKIYPDGTEAVKGVSFEVDEGELCVLLGISGCGKTTTMKMINQLIPITDGEIYIDGKDTTEMDENELRRNIGYAIQDVGLFPHMTVGQNIETVPELKGWSKDERRKRAQELLKLVGMDPQEFIGKYPSELSGGQCQRVGVARCLGADPPILLMDEPFGAIDPITRGKLQDEFLKIQQEIRKTIIFVTHDIYEAIKMGDKIVLMKEGQIVQHDTPANILYRPRDEFVENFVGADRAIKGLQLIRVKEVSGSPLMVKADEKMETARTKAEKEGSDRLAVVDEGQSFLGWVEKMDMEKGGIVRDAMSASDTTVTPNAVLNEALSLMLSRGLNHLAIVDKDNKLEGVLSFDAIRRKLSESSK